MNLWEEKDDGCKFINSPERVNAISHPLPVQNPKSCYPQMLFQAIMTEEILEQKIFCYLVIGKYWHFPRESENHN